MTVIAANLIEVVEVQETSSSAQGKTTGYSTRRFYRPELDVLRLFAYVAVFVHHGVFLVAPTLSNGTGFGLSLFFLLSAFLITELLQREKSATGGIAISEFYIRRCLRIWPLYYGFLAFTVIGGLVFPGHTTSTGFIVAFVCMVGNIYVGRYGFPNNPAGFLWSISIEEQFYLFWPMLNRHCSRWSLRWIALCSVPVASIAIVALAKGEPRAELAIWSNTVVQFQMFAFGALLSLNLRGRLPIIGAFIRAALFLSGFGCWLAAARWTAIFPGAAHAVGGVFGVIIGYLVSGGGCVLIFLSAYGADARWIPKSLVYLGKISYGMYVFHQLSLDTAAWILNRFPETATESHHIRFGIAHLGLGFIVSVLGAALSYKYFERPFLRLKAKFAVVPSRAP